MADRDKYRNYVNDICKTSFTTTIDKNIKKSPNIRRKLLVISSHLLTVFLSQV